MLVPSLLTIIRWSTDLTLMSQHCQQKNTPEGSLELISCQSAQCQVKKCVDCSQGPEDDVCCLYNVIAVHCCVGTLCLCIILCFYPQHTQNVIRQKTHGKNHHNKYNQILCPAPARDGWIRHFCQPSCFQINTTIKGRTNPSAVSTQLYSRTVVTGSVLTKSKQCMLFCPFLRI